MTRLPTLSVIAAAAFLAAAAPSLAAERDFPVGSFDRLAAGGSANITVTTGARPSVHATGEAAALDHLDIRVDGETLKIGTKRDSMWSGWRDHGRVQIAITVPMIRAVDLAGSGTVTVDRIKVRDFDASIGGSGRLDVALLDSDTAKFDVAGSGDMAIAGRCGSAKASIAGSGDLKLTGLKCATFSASVAGSGRIEAYASQTATLSTMGSGDINVSGGARCSVSTAGSGKARCS
ncbi:head GIN domain-containing protein [Polymorphobacter megasporae]|uniref:head GIN domain-containing protein n=1 Tax=Glacieibacterium megasporae TaxID=2835787 RepID=UPI001C1E28F7|nr:head GIN domain-containing protein [Polymorphobacter megasporae]UAJ11833.1 DUF2807 domain-containing protein [Polymorphobacter megasporae]